MVPERRRLVDLEVVASKKSYSRPATAPNGEPWPRFPAEITGYRKSADEGHSTVSIDNRRNDSDVFLKLYSNSNRIYVPVRHTFIPAGGQYTCTDVSAGKYDVRYCDLDTGALLKSEQFQLDEERTFDGIRYSTIEITLYKVANGNMETYPISEAEF